jgi:hypothetical protein
VVVVTINVIEEETLDQEAALIKNLLERTTESVIEKETRVVINPLLVKDMMEDHLQHIETIEEKEMEVKEVVEVMMVVLDIEKTLEKEKEDLER